MSNNDVTGQPTRILHCMLRVLDLERSLHFYRDLLGMRVLRKKDYPSGRFTNVFVGYGSEDSAAVVELTCNWGRTEPYDHGEAFGHVALASPDIYTLCRRLHNHGVEITREPGPMKDGGPEIAFLRDPDGYRIEVIQRT